jgi:heat shock protein HslJ
MKKQSLIFAICLISLFSLNLSCKKDSDASLSPSNTTTGGNKVIPLMGSQYWLISYNGKTIQDTTLNVGLSWDNQNKLFAKFCNNVIATAELKAGTVKAMAISTKMFCNNPSLMEMESVFSQGLTDGVLLSLKANKSDPKQNDLYFTTKDGKTFIFEWKATFIE